nr:tetratricopeptide repeat protein [Candidatus Sigynarchaeota archaeon]
MPEITDDKETYERLVKNIKDMRQVLRETTPDTNVWNTIVDLHVLIMSILEKNGVPVDRDPLFSDDFGTSIHEYITGERAYRDGELDGAETRIKKSIDLLPWNVISRMTLGNMYFVQGRHDDAKKAFAGALDYCTGHARSELLTNLGMNAMRAGHITDAKHYLGDALKENDSNPFALNNLGLVHEMEGDLEGAFQVMAKAVRSKDDDGELWYNLGTIAGKLGKKEIRLYCFVQAERLGMAELKDIIDDLKTQGVVSRPPF